MVSVVLSVSKLIKVFLNTNEYPLDLQISAQALPILPIFWSINPFLPTIINYIHGKSTKHGKMDKTQKITLNGIIPGKWDFD